MAYRLLLLFVILGVNAFFAAAEVSLVSVRRSRLRSMAERGNLGAQAALSLLSSPERLLSVTQVGMTLASLGLGWAGEDTVFQLLAAAFAGFITPQNEQIVHGLCFGFAFLAISYAHVVIGEVVPKNLAIEKADGLALLVAPVLLIFYRVSGPFVLVAERSAAAISRSLGLRGGHTAGVHSTEELKFIIGASAREGLVGPFEQHAISRLLELDEYNVREIMVPRNDVVSIPIDANLDKVLSVLLRHKYSRVPVYEGSPEKIIGILHFKDLIRVWQERKGARDRDRPSRPFRIRRYLRKASVVPESKPVSQLIDEFRNNHTHMALVVDEFGTVTGLVTLEDTLEQIFGEIGDEHDVKRPQPVVEAPRLDVEGTIPIVDLENQYGIVLPSGDFETLAGFLLARTGDLPKAGHVVEYEHRTYTVVEMDRNRIARVRIEKVGKPPASDPPSNDQASAK